MCRNSAQLPIVELILRPLCMINHDEPVQSFQAWVLVILTPPKHATPLKALIGYSWGVLFVYHCVTTASLDSTRLIFIADMKAGDSGNFCVVFMPRSLISVNTNSSQSSLALNYHPQWFCPPPTITPPPPSFFVLNNS